MTVLKVLELEEVWEVSLIDLESLHIQDILGIPIVFAIPDVIGFSGNVDFPYILSIPDRL